jgi:hypothetical protein
MTAMVSEGGSKTRSTRETPAKNGGMQRGSGSPVVQSGKLARFT